MDKKSPKGRVFTIELDSKTALKNMNLANSETDGVFLEGTIGELMDARFEDEVILEVIGEKGTLRVDLQRNEIKEAKK